jgi:hypothetical protein
MSLIWFLSTQDMVGHEKKKADGIPKAKKGNGVYGKKNVHGWGGKEAPGHPPTHTHSER